jgi:hypothetical protein
MSGVAKEAIENIFDSFYALVVNKSKQLGIEKDPLVVNQNLHVKNGKGIVQYTYLVCPTLPKCWVDGMHYHFNKVLVYTENIT